MAVESQREFDVGYLEKNPSWKCRDPPDSRHREISDGRVTSVAHERRCRRPRGFDGGFEHVCRQSERGPVSGRPVRLFRSNLFQLNSRAPRGLRSSSCLPVRPPDPQKSKKVRSRRSQVWNSKAKAAWRCASDPSVKVCLLFARKRAPHAGTYDVLPLTARPFQIRVPQIKARGHRLWLSARARVLNSGPRTGLWLSATGAVFQRRAMAPSVQCTVPHFVPPSRQFRSRQFQPRRNSQQP